MNKIVSNNIIYKNNNIQKSANNVNFRGNFTNKISQFAVDGMSKIEKGGFLLEFLVVDFCGLILPRTYQAFNRNKKELGHPNYKAGIEEFLREILSGPSMIIIPMLALKAASKVLNPSVYIPVENYHALNDVYKTVMEKMKTKHPENVNENFINGIFNKIIKNIIEKHKQIAHKTMDTKEEVEALKAISKKINLKAEREAFTNAFQELLISGNQKDKAGIVNTISGSISKINEIYCLRNNTHNVNLSKKVEIDIRNLADDIVNFAHGTIRKVGGIIAKNNELFINKEKMKASINQIAEIQTGARKAIVLFGIAAVSTFLYFTPKIYQRYKKYPGLDGLVKEPVENKKAEGK